MSITGEQRYTCCGGRWGGLHKGDCQQLRVMPEAGAGNIPLRGNGGATPGTKPSAAENPKDIVGRKKLGMSVVPWTLILCAARALLEGALKYGRFNWRMCGVSASIYLDAIKRHIAKWENGQECDLKTKVHHLDSAIGCLAIMRDSMLYGKFTDDRPPCPDPDAMARAIDDSEAFVAQLTDHLKDHSPHQFTIKDTQEIK